MDLKQYYFITAKDNEDLKASFILYGVEDGVRIIGRIIETNKLIFNRVMLPARLDIRIAHLNKYCNQFCEFPDLIPRMETSQEAARSWFNCLKWALLCRTGSQKI